MIVEAKRIDVRCKTNGYYVRWYNEGWHAWYFRNSSEIYNTQGEVYKTVGWSSISLGDVLSKSQLTSIRGILSAKFIEIFTNDGWKPATISNETFQIGKADRNSSSVSFMISAWLKGAAIPLSVAPEIIVPEVIDYGMLYNSFVIEDVRSVANTGWVIPTYSDWQALTSYLGGDAVAGGKLKTTGFEYWNTPNSSTNEYGFNAKGAGFRQDDAYEFLLLKQRCQFWITTNKVAILYNNQASVSYLNSTIVSSIRLMKTTTDLISGQQGYYWGNDGKFYRTVCINGQEWLSENLAETKYRNGDIIPEVTNRATWFGLSSGAWCAYDNNHIYI